MKLTNLRWWQWGVISLVVGALVGLAFTQLDPDDTSLQSVPLYQFENRVQRRTDAGESVVTRIRVSPIAIDGNGKKMQAVTFWERQRNRITGKWDPTQQFVCRVPVPLSPLGNKTIIDFLTEMKKQMPTLDYQYQWWLVPRSIWIASMAGSFLLIGVLWPIAIQMLVKFGLAEPPDERMNLSAVRTVAAPAAAPTGPVVTADDQQQLADLTAAMEANVAGMGLGSGAPGASRPHADAPVKDLGAGDVLTPAAAIVKHDDPSDFKGEFYPVARPIKKD